jgi:aminoglycoside 3-N-acetyltransferase
MRSPLGRLYELDEAATPGASVLMMGVGYHACTALHLAEYRYRQTPPTQTYSCVTLVGARRRWTVYRDAVLNDSDFEVIGKYLDEENVECRREVRHATWRLMSVRAVVDYATKWMGDHRG